MKIKNVSALIISILIPLAIGSLSALFSGSAAGYPALNNPPLSPPAFVFPTVWTILYILMGISAYLIDQSNDPRRYKALRIYGIQLFFNFFWSILFFRFSQYFPAFLWLAALILLIAVMIKRFFRINPASAYLQIPYLLWCLFAAYLNLMIAVLN